MMNKFGLINAIMIWNGYLSKQFVLVCLNNYMSTDEDI